MAEKPKARSKTTKRSPAAKQKAQSARFIKAARDIGIDESGQEFDLAIKKIVPLKRGPKLPLSKRSSDP